MGTKFKVPHQSHTSESAITSDGIDYTSYQKQDSLNTKIRKEKLETEDVNKVYGNTFMGKVGVSRALNQVYPAQEDPKNSPSKILKKVINFSNDYYKFAQQFPLTTELQNVWQVYQSTDFLDEVKLSVDGINSISDILNINPIPIMNNSINLSMMLLFQANLLVAQYELVNDTNCGLNTEVQLKDNEVKLMKSRYTKLYLDLESQKEAYRQLEKKLTYIEKKAYSLIESNYQLKETVNSLEDQLVASRETIMALRQRERSLVIALANEKKNTNRISLDDENSGKFYRGNGECDSEGGSLHLDTKLEKLELDKYGHNFPDSPFLNHSVNFEEYEKRWSNESIKLGEPLIGPYSYRFEDLMKTTSSLEPPLKDNIQNKDSTQSLLPDHTITLSLPLQSMYPTPLNLRPSSNKLTKASGVSLPQNVESVPEISVDTLRPNSPISQDPSTYNSNHLDKKSNPDSLARSTLLSKTHLHDILRSFISDRNHLAHTLEKSNQDERNDRKHQSLIITSPNDPIEQPERPTSTLPHRHSLSKLTYQDFLSFLGRKDFGEDLGGNNESGISSQNLDVLANEGFNKSKSDKRLARNNSRASIAQAFSNDSSAIGSTENFGTSMPKLPTSKNRSSVHHQHHLSTVESIDEAKYTSPSTILTYAPSATSPLNKTLTLSQLSIAQEEVSLGAFVWKSNRNLLGVEKRVQRFVWIDLAHNLIYWSKRHIDPTHLSHSHYKSILRSQVIRSIRIIYDPFLNESPSGFYATHPMHPSDRPIKSLLINYSASKPLKIKLPTNAQHESWELALNHLSFNGMDGDEKEVAKFYSTKSKTSKRNSFFGTLKRN